MLRIRRSLACAYAAHTALKRRSTERLYLERGYAVHTPRNRITHAPKSPQIHNFHRTSATASITLKTLFTADTMSAARTPTHGRGDVRDRSSALKKRAGVVGGVHNRTPPAARRAGERAKRNWHRNPQTKTTDAKLTSKTVFWTFVTMTIPQKLFFGPSSP